MYYGIGLSDVAEKLVAEPLALACPLDQAGYVYNLARGGHDTARVHYLGQAGKALVGHGYHAHIGLDGTERKVGCLRLGARQAVEKRRLAHVGQAHYTAF